MQNLIAGLLAALGTLLVLAGGAITVVKTVTPEPVVADGAVLDRRSRALQWVRNLRPADRLIGWGVVLLVLAAISAGAIVFNVGASAGTQVH
jgi:hypothetical protein